jgi:hypothetical protein
MPAGSGFGPSLARAAWGRRPNIPAVDSKAVKAENRQKDKALAI